MFDPRNVYVPFVAKGGLGFLYGFNCTSRRSFFRVGPTLMLRPGVRSGRKLRSTARVPEHHRHRHPLGEFLLWFAGPVRTQHELHRLCLLADAGRAEGRCGARVAVVQDRCCGVGRCEFVRGHTGTVAYEQYRAHGEEEGCAWTSKSVARLLRCVLWLIF